MPLRPIDAIFVDPKRRLYVVYYRGVLWQLPRMKIDDKAWQRRTPYIGAPSELYLSGKQAIHDPQLAQKLRTLHLPKAVRGATLPRFEDWWEVHGFKWLKEQLDEGKSPLTASPETTFTSKATNTYPASDTADSTTTTVKTQAESTDIFADMLAKLVDEVRHHHDS